MEKFIPTEMELIAEELVMDTHAPGKHCARNAFFHIKKAWQLADIDREMAAFRAITAEEESATAIFHALKRRKYRGAEILKLRDHLHKNALVPFLAAVTDVLRLTNELGLRTSLAVNKMESPRRIRVRVDISNVFGREAFAFPEPPLHFDIKAEDGSPIDFSRQLDGIAKLKRTKNIIEHVMLRANLRNKLLYASADGFPSVTNLNKFLDAQRKYVFMNVILYLLIDPYKDKQLFVQQSLQSFLKMLDLLPGDIVFE